jgi:hypothetical protein
MDTLAARLMVPLTGSIVNFHHQVKAPCRAHDKKRYTSVPLAIPEKPSEGDISLKTTNTRAPVTAHTASAILNGRTITPAIAKKEIIQMVAFVIISISKDVNSAGHPLIITSGLNNH